MSWNDSRDHSDSSQGLLLKYLQSPTIIFSIILIVSYIIVGLSPPIVRDLLIQCNPCILMEYGLPWTPWTLVTSIFLHATPLHLASNVFFLLIFGYILEEQLQDRIRWIEIFLITGIVGNISFLLAYVALGPDVVGQLGVGASGAVYGILGAAAGLKIAVLLILIAGLDVYAGGGVFAHIGGLFAGILIRRFAITRTSDRFDPL